MESDEGFQSCTSKHKSRLNILTDEEVERINKQKLLDKEIEEEGILIGWKAANVSSQLKNLKNQTIVKYKNTKVMRFGRGNILLCNQHGCYTPVKTDMIMCDSHIKGNIKFNFCTSKTICTLQPCFGYEINKPLFCRSHSKEEMTDVKNKKCVFPDCKKKPSFNLVGEPHKFCLEHKTENMIDVCHKKCIYPECNTRATCQYFGKTTPEYCLEHKLTDMVNVEKTKCGYKGCKITPSYGFKDDKLRYCRNHKSPQMKDLVTKKCSFLGCETAASFGNEGGKVEYCKKHMKIQMIDIHGKKCLFNGCSKYPSFGLQGEQSSYCYDHKSDGMINVKSGKCTINNCNTVATYGYLFSKANNHCYDHSNLNEYNKAKRSPRCSDVFCASPAIFIDYEDKLLQPLRCINHKISTDIELVQKVCTICYIKLYIPNNKDICADCGNYRCKITNCKENELKILLKIHNIPFIHNKSVHIDGSSKRPDFLIESIFGKIILECDEFQHAGYDKELDRMKIVYKDIQLLSKRSEVLFIRYNPDNYKGLQYTNSDRLEYLQFLLKHYIQLKKLTINLGVIYLFYNGFNGYPQIKEIQIDN